MNQRPFTIITTTQRKARIFHFSLIQKERPFRFILSYRSAQTRLRGSLSTKVSFWLIINTSLMYFVG